MRTLYVSDLDGTLLTPEARLSARTTEILNALIGKGLCFSYATARSIATSAKVTEGLRASLPVVTKNGTFLVDPSTRQIVDKTIFTPEEAREILEAYHRHGLRPLVFTLLDGKDVYSYEEGHVSPGNGRFLASHAGDGRARPLPSEDGLLDGEVHYFVSIGTEAELRDAAEELGRSWRCILSRDTYTEDMWLEVMPRHATKAEGVQRLKAITGCDRVVAFGDGVNDLPMFQIADACYAMEDADKRLKSAATAVIGSNTRDGVAEWLLAHAELEEGR